MKEDLVASTKDKFDKIEPSTEKSTALEHSSLEAIKKS